MTAPVHGDGRLAITVWPTFIGVIGRCIDGTLGEPTHHPDYQRSQITWTTGALVTGRARINVPAGEWTHFAYFRGPGDHEPVGEPIPIGQFPIQLIFSGAIFADPIIVN
ncbi:hypothetical protein QNM97_13685 [Gordonia sp. L191]|uniref:hypothetical protein n=1 Tax=Gordonia sp. L191 TaxID=2982699 RepID=UPI0024C05181|nr:hypothetical protein [Gordonia sp. L191]WHU45102.1 hypothetical protein QNM97_13685 [Gordonia sp. L191]